MTAVWIALAALAVLVAALALSLLLRARPPSAGRARASIEHLANDTSADSETGAVRSVQSADLQIDREALDEIWTPVHLERLARTYWRFLTRVTLGLIRVRYSDSGRSVVLLTDPFRLLTFEPPEYEIDAGHGVVRWRIRRGLLVARRGRDGAGYLQIEVVRQPGERSERQTMHVEVSVVNFYPAIASRLGIRIYEITQSRIHVIVTYGFLRSLARLDLAESRTGRFAAR